MSKISLNTQILLGTLFGILSGLWFAMLGQEYSLTQNTLYTAKLVSTLFIDLLRMVLIPLVFTSIVVGVANLRSHQQMNRVWQGTLFFFFQPWYLLLCWD